VRMRFLRVVIAMLLITAGGGGENQGPLVIYDIDIQLRTLKIKMQLLFKGSDVIRPHFGAREEA
jgi:hypothetical protein